MPPRPGDVVGGFRLLDCVGAGGMGEVYRARRESAGDIVALKFCTAGTLDARLLARIYHEAQVQGSLDHPNIVRLHQLLTVDGRPCLVLEYVDGKSLADVIYAEGALSPERALRILAGVAGAVAAIHAIGVLHRDIKPGNIRLTRDGTPKVLDFGIAKSDRVRGLTTHNFVVGTPQYLSPEQLRLMPATPASDVWALGIVLYEMTTGRVPFSGETTTDALARIQSERVIPPSRRMREVPGRLGGVVDELVAACLMREPARRTITARAVAERAGAALSATPGRAEPRTPRRPTPHETPWQMLRKRVSQTTDAVGVRSRHVLAAHPWWVLATAAVVVTMILAVAWRSGMAGGSQPVALADQGRHVIDVQSGTADIYVDGVYFGRTPGTYVGRLGQVINVEVRRPGFKPTHERIQLAPNGTSTLALSPVRTP